MQVSVHGSPAAWWQHSGHAALQECRLISRRQAPFSGIAQRRANRQLYQVFPVLPVWHSCCMSNPPAHNPLRIT